MLLFLFFSSFGVSPFQLLSPQTCQSAKKKKKKKEGNGNGHTLCFLLLRRIADSVRHQFFTNFYKAETKCNKHYFEIYFNVNNFIVWSNTNSNVKKFLQSGFSFYLAYFVIIWRRKTWREFQLFITLKEHNKQQHSVSQSLIEDVWRLMAQITADPNAAAVLDVLELASGLHYGQPRPAPNGQSLACSRNGRLCLFKSHPVSASSTLWMSDEV